MNVDEFCALDIRPPVHHDRLKHDLGLGLACSWMDAVSDDDTLVHVEFETIDCTQEIDKE